MRRRRRVRSEPRLQPFFASSQPPESWLDADLCLYDARRKAFSSHDSRGETLVFHQAHSLGQLSLEMQLTASSSDDTNVMLTKQRRRPYGSPPLNSLRSTRRRGVVHSPEQTATASAHVSHADASLWSSKLLDSVLEWQPQFQRPSLASWQLTLAASEISSSTP